MQPASQGLELVPPVDGSELAMTLLRLDRAGGLAVGDVDSDTLLYVVEGSGSLALGDGEAALGPGAAALVLAGEQGEIEASTELAVLHATVGPGADRHAPLGPRETSVRLAQASSEAATGARSFQILFGPHNGSTRATLFAGYIPAGKAPWHYHLYDEIVWVPEGPARLHLRETEQEVRPGSAFRLRPRQLHIVENAGDMEMTIIGVFTPAGSPSAAYLTPDVAAAYRFAG